MGTRRVVVVVVVGSVSCLGWLFRVTLDWTVSSFCGCDDGVEDADADDDKDDEEDGGDDDDGDADVLFLLALALAGGVLDMIFWEFIIVACNF